MHFTTGGRLVPRKLWSVFMFIAWSKRPNMSVAKENLETESLGIVISKRFAITNELFSSFGDIIVLRDFILAE
jgi:hypothetical protein